MKKKLVNIGLIAILAGAGCGESQRVDNKNVDKVDSRTLENYDLKERLEKTNGADEKMVIIVRYANNSENIDEVKNYLTSKNVRQINEFDYSKISTERLEDIETIFSNELGYDLNLPENTKDYSFSQRIALFYTENIFKN